MTRKIDYLENTNDLQIINNSFKFLRNLNAKQTNTITDTDPDSTKNIPDMYVEKIDKKAIDETVIRNAIKEAWKENEKLDSKLSSFKTTITKAKEPLINAKNLELLSKAVAKKDSESSEGKLFFYNFIRQE